MFICVNEADIYRRGCAYSGILRWVGGTVWLDRGCRAPTALFYNTIVFPSFY